jgi:hypothetical protein
MCSLPIRMAGILIMNDPSLYSQMPRFLFGMKTKHKIPNRILDLTKRCRLDPLVTQSDDIGQHDSPKSTTNHCSLFSASILYTCSLLMLTAVQYVPYTRHQQDRNREVTTSNSSLTRGSRTDQIWLSNCRTVFTVAMPRLQSPGRSSSALPLSSILACSMASGTANPRWIANSVWLFTSRPLLETSY